MQAVEPSTKSDSLVDPVTPAAVDASVKTPLAVYVSIIKSERFSPGATAISMNSSLASSCLARVVSLESFPVPCTSEINAIVSP